MHTKNVMPPVESSVAMRMPIDLDEKWVSIKNWNRDAKSNVSVYLWILVRYRGKIMR